VVRTTAGRARESALSLQRFEGAAWCSLSGLPGWPLAARDRPTLCHRFRLL
jgi:hypothetical protein